MGLTVYLVIKIHKCHTLLIINYAKRDPTWIQQEIVVSNVTMYNFVYIYKQMYA